MAIKVLIRKEEVPDLLPERFDDLAKEQPLTFLGEQPIYDPLQVVSSNTLQPLLVVQTVDNDGFRNEYVLIDEPKQQNNIVYVRALDTNTGFERKIGLADYAVIPYKGADWSDSGNYMVSTGQKMTTNEINILMTLSNNPSK